MNSILIIIKKKKKGNLLHVTFCKLKNIYKK